MVSLSLPLNISGGGLKRQNDTRTSVDTFLLLLLNTARYSCVPDPDFGFVLNNLRFESVSENEGVVRSGRDTRQNGDLYNKKISGTSSNRETFAYELKTAIETYEKRLSSVKVTMTYIRQEKIIHISIKGRLVEDDSDYLLTTDMKVWN